MEEVVLNELDKNGMRRLRVLGDRPIDPSRYSVVIPREAETLVKVAASEDAALGLHAIEISWPAREAFDIHLPHWPKFRRMVIWTIIEGERMSEAIGKAADKFEALFGKRPGFCFAGHLPRGVEAGTEVHGCMLFEAEWVPKRMIAVGGPGEKRGSE